MTTENFADSDELLPGLGDPAPTESALELAARRTLRALDDAELLVDRDALICQLVLTMARATDAGVRSKRASAASMAAAQLLAAMDRLPGQAEGGIDDEVRRLVEELREAGSVPHVRDPAGSEPAD